MKRFLPLVMVFGLLALPACEDDCLHNYDYGLSDDLVLSVDVVADASQPDESVGPIASYRVVTFNVMCSVCGSSAYDNWAERVGYFGDIFARLQPDLVGLQEPIFSADIDQMLEVMPGYAALYYPGDDETYLPYPDAAVLYKMDRFDVVESGEYWLSPTPDEPWSMGHSEGQSIPRVVVWAHLRDKSAGNLELYFATTHFDSTHPHQEKSAPQMIRALEPWAQNMPVIQTGDFNTEPRDPAFNILTNGIDADGFQLDDAFASVGNHWNSETNQTDMPAYDPINRIDHIFTAGGTWRTASWTVDLFKFGEKIAFPSDHRLIWADLDLFSQD